jgi:hypothetical protein
MSVHLHVTVRPPIDAGDKKLADVLTRLVPSASLSGMGLNLRDDSRYRVILIDENELRPVTAALEAAGLDCKKEV